jgi:hypothetical protein
MIVVSHARIDALQRGHRQHRSLCGARSGAISCCTHGSIRSRSRQRVEQSGGLRIVEEAGQRRGVRLCTMAIAQGLQGTAARSALFRVLLSDQKVVGRGRGRCSW